MNAVRCRWRIVKSTVMTYMVCPQEGWRRRSSATRSALSRRPSLAEQPVIEPCRGFGFLDGVGRRRR